MSEFILKYDMWILALGLSLILGVYFYQRVAANLRERRRRFDDRPVLSEDTWFTKLYPVTSKRDRALAVEILGAIAHEIGIDWRRLRPDDSFEQVLGINPKRETDLDLVETVMRIEDLVMERGISATFEHGFLGTISEFLDEWIAINRADNPNG